MLRLMLPAEIERDWDWLESRCPLHRLRERVMSGNVVAFRIEGTDAALLLASGKTIDTGGETLWAVGLGGKIGASPKGNFRLMAAILARCEAIGRFLGCDEFRIEAGDRAGWKAALLPRFGFEEGHVGDARIFRKAISWA